MPESMYYRLKNEASMDMIFYTGIIKLKSLKFHLSKSSLVILRCCPCSKRDSKFIK